MIIIGQTSDTSIQRRRLSYFAYSYYNNYNYYSYYTIRYSSYYYYYYYYYEDLEFFSTYEEDNSCVHSYNFVCDDGG